MKRFEEQGGRCFYSGFPLSFKALDPYQVSIERLKNVFGYTEWNCVLICQVFNLGNAQMSREKFQRLMMDCSGPMEVVNWEVTLCDPTFKRKTRSLIRNARSATMIRTRNRPHEAHDMSLTRMDIRNMFVEQLGRCAYSGIPMRFSDGDTDWVMSLERKNPSMGYTVENCCLVCRELNGHCQIDKELVDEWRRTWLQ